MTSSEIRWVIAVPDPDGGLELFRLTPLGAALEFRAPDRTAAERMVFASEIDLPGDALLISRLEFDERQRSSSGAPSRSARLARTLTAPIPDHEV
jgi:hypothetical protein